MGSCFSSTNTEFHPRSPSAKVVSINGDLKEFPVPVTVYQVILQLDSSSNPCFLCSSDALYFDELVTALKMDYQLEANQLYFILPMSKLERPLTASDMAALAVKASEALKKSSYSKDGHRVKKKARISPVLFNDNSSDVNYYNKDTAVSSIDGLLIKDSYSHEFENEITIGFGQKKKQSKVSNTVQSISRAESVKKVQRFASKRTLSAVRSFKLRLSIIYEATAF